MKIVAFRLNIGTNVGLGHFYRCKYLAEVFTKNGFICEFIIDKKNLFFNNFKKIIFTELYNKSSFKSEDKDLKISLENLKEKTKFLIIDDYRITDKWVKLFKKKNKKVKIVVFDDNHLKQSNADYIINTSKNFSTDKLRQNQPKLYGTDFSIINPKLKKEKNKKLINILFYFGGGYDYKGYSKNIINISKKLIKINSKIRINFINGPFSKNFNLIKKNLISKKFIIHENIFDLSNILSKIDLCIGSASSIVYELNYLKISSILFTLNEKQNNTNLLEKMGFNFVLDIKDLKNKNITKIIENFYQNIFLQKKQKLKHTQITKYGANNIVRILLKKKLNFKKGVNSTKQNKNKHIFQKANISDVNIFLKIRNYKKNRLVSANTKKIKKIDHYLWWLNNDIEKFKLIQNNEIIMILWRKKINFNGKIYYTGGWSTTKFDFNLSGILFAYKKLLTFCNSKNIPWIGITKKNNKFLKWLNLRLGFSILKENKFNLETKKFLKNLKIKNKKKYYIYIT